MQEEHSRKRGFAAISSERMREIARAGGIARKRAFDEARAPKKRVVAMAPVPASGEIRQESTGRENR